jgi:uncharacterized protein YqfA (UPF0365 family)
MFVAYRVGLKLSFKKAAGLTIRRITSRDFFLNVKEIQEWSDIPMHDLEIHYLAGGNMGNLKNGIALMAKKNRPIDFKVLSAFDFAGRNLKEEIEKAEGRGWEFRWD